MDTSQIKVILFDYGGVLAEEGFRNALLALASEQALDVDGIVPTAMQTVYDCGYVLGKGTVSEFWDLLKERTGLAGNETELTNRVLDGFILRNWMMDFIKQLRARGYAVGILSDQTHWLDELNTRDHFFEQFDHIFNSYYLGLGKRNPELFSEIEKQLMLSADEILFIDDSEINIYNARNAGWSTILYVNKEQFLSDIGSLLAVDFQAWKN